MSNQNTPRNINFSGARTGNQPSANNINQPQRVPTQPQQGRAPVYDQAADAQRQQGAAQGQVRRTAQGQPMRPGAHNPTVAQQAARRQQMAAQQQQSARSASQQRQAMAAQQRPEATYEEYTLDRQHKQAPQQMVQRQAPPQTAQRQAMQRPSEQAQNGRRSAADAQTQNQQQRPLKQPAQVRGAASVGQQRSVAASAAMPQSRQPYRADGAGAAGGAGGGRGGKRPDAAQGAGTGAEGGSQESLAEVRKRKKLKSLNRALTAICASFAVFLVCYVGLRVYAGTIINTGEGGVTTKEYRTPPQYAGTQLNVLLIGIDYTAEDGQSRSPNGMTDMIMYVRFDFKDNTIRMLQVPRDLFVGPQESTGGTGKINALYANGEDKENRVNNIAKVLSEQYQLPVDNYVSIDMDSLREIIDLFGGIDVYVTDDMEYNGSFIPQGLQHLDGASSEFFLRNRKQYATSDMRRLENQRYFYSALFSLVRTSPWQEIVKLVPVVREYINTDVDPVDCAALGIKMLKIPSSQILIARLPVAGAAEQYNGQSIIVCSVPETTELLNQYFRSQEQQVAAEQLNIAQLPIAGGVHPSNVQWMSDIDADGGGPVGEAADATQTGDDVLQEVASASQSQADNASASAPAA